MKRGDPIDLLVAPCWIGAPYTTMTLAGRVAWVEPCPNVGQPGHRREAVLLPALEAALLTTWPLFHEGWCEEFGASVDLCFGPARIWVVPR